MGQVLKVQLHVLDLQMQHPQEWDSWLCVCESNGEGLYAVVQGLVLVIWGGPAGWSMLLVHAIAIETTYAVETVLSLGVELVVLILDSTLAM